MTGKYQSKVIIFVGFECQFEHFEDAIDWIHEQKGYKDKSVKYVISCGREVDID